MRAKPRLPVEVSLAAATGSVLRRAREMRDVTQQQLAAAVGVSASAWSRLEAGRCCLTVEQLNRACRYLGHDPWVVLELACMELER